MKKVTIITGDQGSGKTEAAKELSRGKKSIWLSSLPKAYEKDLLPDTEVIVIEGLVAKDLERFKALITSRSLTFRPKYSKEAVHMQRPEIIATTNCLNKRDCRVRSYVEFIETGFSAAHRPVG